MSNVKHVFDIDIASEYGVNAAILLENIGYWVKQNEANGTNYYDGQYWTFNSLRALRELFPYMSEKQIYTALQKLIDAGLIVTGNYNSNWHDRTLWYSLTEKGKWILHYGKMDFPSGENGFSREGKCLYNTLSNKYTPNINTDINTDINDIGENPPEEAEPKPKTEYKEIIDYLNQRAGTAFRPSSRATQSHINARLAEGFKVEDFKIVIDKMSTEWIGTEMQQYLRPETLFGAKFEGYLNAKTKRSVRQQTQTEGKSLDDLNKLYQRIKNGGSRNEN